MVKHFGLLTVLGCSLVLGQQTQKATPAAKTTPKEAPRPAESAKADLSDEAQVENVYRVYVQADANKKLLDAQEIIAQQAVDSASNVFKQTLAVIGNKNHCVYQLREQPSKDPYALPFVCVPLTTQTAPTPVPNLDGAKSQPAKK